MTALFLTIAAAALLNAVRLAAARQPSTVRYAAPVARQSRIRVAQITVSF